VKTKTIITKKIFIALKVVVLFCTLHLAASDGNPKVATSAPQPGPEATSNSISQPKAQQQDTTQNTTAKKPSQNGYTISLTSIGR